MSITDKLPAAPEGTYWTTTLSVNKEGPAIWLKLEPETWHRYHFKDFGFAAPDVESIISRANHILAAREEANREGEIRDRELAEAKLVYADLLTDEI